MRFSGQKPQNSRAQRANLLCASTVSMGQAATCEWWQPALRAARGKSRKSTQKQLQRELVIYMCMCIYIYIHMCIDIYYIYIYIYIFIYIIIWSFHHISSTEYLVLQRHRRWEIHPSVIRTLNESWMGIKTCPQWRKTTTSGMLLLFYCIKLYIYILHCDMLLSMYMLCIYIYIYLYTL